MQVAPIVDHCHTAADVMAAARRSTAFRREIETRERARRAAERQLMAMKALDAINAEKAAQAEREAREVAENKARQEYAEAVKKKTALRVVKLGCEILGVSYQNICSDRRMKPLPDYRHCLAWCAREITPRSLISIGAVMGDRDHTSILHGIRRVEADILAGGDLGKKAVELKAEIERRFAQEQGAV